MSDLQINFNIKVMHANDRVRIMFDFPVGWLELDKPQAEQLALLIHAHASAPPGENGRTAPLVPIKPAEGREPDDRFDPGPQMGPPK